MDAKTLRDVAAYLLEEAAALEVPRVMRQVYGSGQNVFDDGHFPQGPWDPSFPGYESGDAGQIMDRKYARVDGHADMNFYVKAKFAKGVGKAPKWPDEEQEWEVATR